MKKQIHQFLFAWFLVEAVIIFLDCDLAAQTLFKNEAGKYGFRNKNEIIIPAKYDTAYDFEFGLARVKLNNKWGYIDETGKEIVPIKFFWIEPALFLSFDETVDDRPTGWYVMKLNSKADPWKYVDKAGNNLLFDDYSSDGYSEGMLEVSSGNKWGFADENGKLVTPLKYQQVKYFQRGLAPVKLNNKWGLIDKTGKEITPVKYDTIRLINYNEADWYKFGISNKFGLIDSLGNEVIQAKYENIYSFTEDLAAFKLNNKWGYLDKKGKEIIPAQYEVVYPFKDGKASVKKDGRTFLIDNPLQK